MMKSLQKIKFSVPFLILACLFFVACEKKTVFGDIEPNTDRVIAEFADAQDGKSFAFDFSTTETEIELAELRLFVRSKPSGNVQVKFAVNPTVVADYNTENGTSYTSLPNGSYTLSSNDVVLSGTDRRKIIRMKLVPANLVGGQYAIGLSITEVNEGEVSSHNQNIFITLSVKNKYDGLYEVTGSCVDLAGTYTGLYPNYDVGLRTADANSVDYLDPIYSVGAPFFDNAYIMLNSGTGGLAWLFSPRFVFDPATDKVVDILDNDGSVSAGAPDPAGPNQFTVGGPDDKQFEIKYTVFGRFVITETWTYTGPR